jgi:Abnormal spindle-like microcephaly-assoc'd, ASPM-SPD-2-Hydin
MRLPQLDSQPFFIRRLSSLALGAAFLIAGFAPKSATAKEQQLTCSPASLRFGNVEVGQTETLLVTVTNNGETSVTLSNIAASNAEFTTSSVSLPITLAAGQGVDLNIDFTPSATGGKSGTITFSTGGSGSALVLDLAGTGVSSESATASPSTLSFGRVATGAHSTLPVAITNTRAWNVTLTSVRIAGTVFSSRGTSFPVTLKAGQSVTVNVTFTPQSTGESGGSLFVDGPGLNIPLTGTGTTGTQYSVSLWWNSSQGVEGYNIYRSTSASGTFSKINSALDANTAYTDSTVASGQTYYYEATSVNSSGAESARSTPAIEVAIP